MFLGPHLHQSIIHLVSSIFGTTPISIGHLSCQLNLVWVFRTTPISIGHRLISLSLGFLGCTYIDRLSSYRFSLVWVFQDRTYIDPSFILLVQFSGPHLYQSVIILSIWVWVFGVVPISISYLPISSVQFEFFRTTPISIDHSSYQFSFWGHTYINWLSSCQFVFSLFFWDHTYINRSFILSVQFEFLGPHLYR